MRRFGYRRRIFAFSRAHCSHYRVEQRTTIRSTGRASPIPPTNKIEPSFSAAHRDDVNRVMLLPWRIAHRIEVITTQCPSPHVDDPIKSAREAPGEQP